MSRPPTSRRPVARVVLDQLEQDQPTPRADAAFEGDLRATVARLRESVAEVLAAVGANLRVPHSITRDFGLDKSLASKLARVVREPDPFAAALDVPGEEAMRIFSRSMRDAGAPAQTLEALRESVESFQAMVRKHCGDRATLEMLAGSAGGAASQKQQQQQGNFRKTLFRGASAVFGVQARVDVAAHFLAPSAGQPGMYDVALVGGLVDLRRIRSDVAWAVASMRTIEQGAPGPLVPFEPIEPIEPLPAHLPQPTSPDDVSAPLMREFCSKPVPELRATRTADAMLRFELPEGPVGSTSAVTVFTGWLYRNASAVWPTAAEDDGVREHFASVNTPVELQIMDLFVHKDLPFAREPEALLYSQLPGGVSYPGGPRDRGLLPLTEPIQDLSGLPPRPATPHIADYVRLTRTVFARMGHAAEDFYGVRIQLAYPPVPSMLMFRYSLPKKS